jgi:hypothetical protein
MCVHFYLLFWLYQTHDEKQKLVVNEKDGGKRENGIKGGINGSALLLFFLL